MKKRKNKSSAEADVDMTPMLDIVFIMLIFFIVTSTFIHEIGVDITEHKTDENNKNKKKSKAIIVQICEDKSIYVNKRSVDIRSVRANIERTLSEDSQAAVIIESEEKAPTGALVMVMDQARAAKASISVAPLPKGCNAGTATTI